MASYKRWQSLGRHVLKGARAQEVIVPMVVQEPAPEPGPADDADETGEQQRERVARLVGFKVVRGVFALSDTAGPELPPVQLPAWDLDTALQRLDIRQVPFTELNGNVQGYARDRDIAINPEAVNPEKTLFHELGHVVLGHIIASRVGEYATHRGMMEFQAEATAYLALNELGRLDDDAASHSRGYIRHWLQAEQPGDREIRLVFAATEQILCGGQLAVSNTVQAGRES